MSVLPYLVAAWLLAVGLYGVATSRHLVHLVLSLSVAQASTYVLLLAIGYREGGRAPVFADLSPGTPVVDPVVQALTLTDRKFLLIQYNYARTYAVATNNRELFDRLIQEVLDAGDISPENRLPNKIAQRRARRLRAQADELFFAE